MNLKTIFFSNKENSNEKASMAKPKHTKIYKNQTIGKTVKLLNQF